MDHIELDHAMAAVEAELELEVVGEVKNGESYSYQEQDMDIVIAKKSSHDHEDDDDDSTDAEVDEYYRENYNNSDPLNILRKNPYPTGEVKVTFHPLSGEPLHVKIDLAVLQPFRKKRFYSRAYLIGRHAVLQQMVTQEYRRVFPPDEDAFGFELDADQARLLNDGVEMESDSQAFMDFKEMILDGDEEWIKQKYPFLQVVYQQHRYVPGPEEYWRIQEANASAGQRMAASGMGNSYNYYNSRLGLLSDAYA